MATSKTRARRGYRAPITGEAVCSARCRWRNAGAVSRKARAGRDCYEQKPMAGNNIENCRNVHRRDMAYRGERYRRKYGIKDLARISFLAQLDIRPRFLPKASKYWRVAAGEKSTNGGRRAFYADRLMSTAEYRRALTYRRSAISAIADASTAKASVVDPGPASAAAARNISYLAVAGPTTCKT